MHISESYFLKFFHSQETFCFRQLIIKNPQAILTSGAHFVRKQIYLKFPYHILSNFYSQTANFIIEQLKSTFVLMAKHIHFTEVCKLSMIMGKLNWGFLYDSFVLVNIISLKTNPN